MNKRKIAVAAVGITGLLTGTVCASQAIADPSGPPPYRQLSGVGSDTTQGVLNGLANAITINGTKVIGSYDATGSAQVTTKDPATTPGCTINRPNGSNAGRTALLNSLQAGNGCLDFARSSSLNLGAANPGLTYVPFAVDAVSYSITPTSTVPRKLALADLKAIYHCDPNYVGTAPNFSLTVYLPQAGSGVDQGQAIRAQRFEEAETLLLSVNAVLDSNNLFFDPLAAEYLQIVTTLSADGYEAQSIRLSDKTATATAIRTWPTTESLTLTRDLTGWQMAGE